MQRKPLILLICLLAVVAAVLGIWLLGRNYQHVAWYTQGFFVNADGSTEPAVLKINGTIHYNQDGADKINISITGDGPPLQSFPYNFVRNYSGDYSQNRVEGYLPEFLIVQCSISSISAEGLGEFLPGYFALDPKNKAFIAVFEDFPGCYLVTSQNPDPDAQQLLAHFADFIEDFGYTSPTP